MTVNRYATQAGRKFQRDVMKYLRDERGLDAEQLVLSGAEDEGDILLRAGDTLVPTSPSFYELTTRRFVLEAKREKRINLAGWVNQAETEAGNYGKHRGIETPHFAVVANRINRGINKSYVITTLDEWLRQIT